MIVCTYINDVSKNQIIFLSVSAVSLYEINQITIFYGNATNDLFIRFPNVLDYTLFSSSGLGPIESGDLNDDGLDDLVVCNQAKLSASGGALLHVLANTGDTRQLEIATVNVPGMNCHYFVAIGDFYSIGKQDSVSAYDDGGGVVTFRYVNYTTGLCAFESHILHEQALSVTKGKFSDDEFDDLAFILRNEALQILLGNGDGTFTQQIYSIPSHSMSVTRMNFNNDTIDDVAILSCNRTVTVFLGMLNGFFNRNYLSFKSNERNSSQCAHSLKVADLNQDGRDDLVFIDAETHSIGVFMGTIYNEES